MAETKDEIRKLLEKALKEALSGESEWNPQLLNAARQYLKDIEKGSDVTPVSDAERVISELRKPKNVQGTE